MAKHDKKQSNKPSQKNVNNVNNQIDKAQKQGATKAEEADKKSGAKIIAAVLLPLLAIYFGGVALFNYIFVPHTSFEGYGFSFKSPDAIAQAMEEDTKSRVLKLVEIDGEETISLHEEIDYVKSAEAPEGGWIDSMTAWQWPKYLFTNNELKGTLNVNYSQDKLEGVVSRLKAMQAANIRPPQNAYLGRDGDDYKVVPEDPGNELIREKLVGAIQDSINNSNEELDLVEADCYTKPTVYRDDPVLTDTYNKYKSINFQKISFDMVGDTVVLETPDILALYGEDGPSEELIREFVQNMRLQYETYEEERPFINHYGESIMVGTRADTYGFLIDEDATVDMIYDLMVAKKSEDTSPVWASTALYRFEDGSDIGNTYIEISIGGQVLWGYINGEEVISTSCVTGMYNKYDTPRGVFQILSKARDTHLKGQVGKDKWDSFVNFWMPINWSGVGMHNAPWRSSFGGEIYNGNGSHGCINLNYESAEYIFNNFDYGTPVVIW